jgi:hypothetical protein
MGKTKQLFMDIQEQQEFLGVPNLNPIEMEEPQYKAKITAEKFMDFYVDFQTAEHIGYLILDQIHERNEPLNVGFVSIQGLFDACGYIPAKYCEGFSAEDETEFQSSEVELILYKEEGVFCWKCQSQIISEDTGNLCSNCLNFQ